MRRLRAFLVRLASHLPLRDRDADFAAELDSHLQHHIDDNISAGMTPDEARRAALIALGGVVQTKERYRDRQRIPWIDSLRQDLFYAVRVLARDPAFAFTASR